MKVLVAFATKNGSTEEVAAAVAAAMREQGAQVVLRPAAAVREPVAGYDLVVLGAPLYSGRWHKDASRFLRRRRRDLPDTPVAVFAMGPRQNTAESWRRSRAQLDRALSKRSWLNPVAVTVFGGTDPLKRGARGGQDRRDLRDWDNIRVWAERTLAAPTCAGGSQSPGTAATSPS
jgi:menaquinone-dependent protoporphyrinogen oxidase